MILCTRLIVTLAIGVFSSAFLVCCATSNSQLAEAARMNDIALVEELVSSKGGVNDPVSISLAAKEGNSEIVEILLKVGTDPNEIYALHPPPLISAVVNNHFDTVKVLLEGGANPNVRHGQASNTALLLATDENLFDIMLLLLEVGADPNIKNSDDITPLVMAIVAANGQAVNLLLANGADPNLSNRFDTTPLMFASKIGNVDILESLIDSGANLDSVNYMDSALITAACNNSDEVVSALLKSGANPDIKSGFGKFPLLCAAKESYISIVQQLVDAGANVDLQDKYGRTAIIEAADNNDVFMVEFLLDLGATPDLAQTDGVDAIQIAESAGNLRIVVILDSAIRGTTRPPSPQLPTPPRAPNSNYTIITGTGWLVSAGYIVTNYHVVEGNGELVIRFNSLSEDLYPARVVMADSSNDLAILEFIGDKNPTVTGIPISTILPRLGEEVFTIGYPKTDVMGKNPKVTDGIISSLSGIQDDPRILQTTVAIQSGNSGGPLLNLSGEAVGVTTATLRAQIHSDGLDIPQSVNYAVKTAYVAALLSGLPRKNNPNTINRKRSNIADLIPGLQDSIVQVIVKK
jgi:ankyrin repeat protein